MLQKIQEVYERLNVELVATGKFNTKDYQLEIKQRLEKELPSCNIKCDIENNPPDIIENCCLVAMVYWANNSKNMQYTHLVFGQESGVQGVYKSNPHLR